MHHGEHAVRPTAAAARLCYLPGSFNDAGHSGLAAACRCKAVAQDACGEPEDWAAVRALMDAGVDLMELDEDRFNAPLHWAAWHGRHTLARLPQGLYVRARCSSCCPAVPRHGKPMRKGS